jgi:hypothetical protein
VIRERPPTPPQVSTEPLIIERRVPVPEKHRKIIIEHLPPPPAKPRDIILEKWLPQEAQQPRQVFIQKTLPPSGGPSNQILYQQIPNSRDDHRLNQSSSYSYMNNHPTSSNCSGSNSRQMALANQPFNGVNGADRSNSTNSIQRPDQRPSNQHTPSASSMPKKSSLAGYRNRVDQEDDVDEEEPYYRRASGRTQQPSNSQYGSVNSSTRQHSAVYSPPEQPKMSGVQHHHHVQQMHAQAPSPSQGTNGKLAGYRIIRQIIPGPNMSASDVQNVLARSKPLSTTVYSNHSGIYANHSNASTSPYDAHNTYSTAAAAAAHNPIYYPSSASNSNTSMYSNSFVSNPNHMRVRGPGGMPVNFLNGGNGGVIAMGSGGPVPIYPSKIDVYVPHKKVTNVSVVNTTERIRKGDEAYYSHLKNKNDKYHRCASNDHF